MSNPKTDRQNDELTGLAAECWAVLSSSYNPLKILELCRKVQALQDAHAQALALTQNQPQA